MIMCGIDCQIRRIRNVEGSDQSKGSHQGHATPSLHSDHLAAVQRRGPDAVAQKTIQIGEYSITLTGAVLHLRGACTRQPIEHAGMLLAFNGELYSGLPLSDDICDTQALMDALSSCSHDTEGKPQSTYMSAICEKLQGLQGPAAFCCIDVARRCVWFARDVFGRRSLCAAASEDMLHLSSVAVQRGDEARTEVDAHVGGNVCSGNGGDDVSWIEVPAAGVYCLQLPREGDEEEAVLACIPWRTRRDESSAYSHLFDDVIARSSETIQTQLSQFCSVVQADTPLVRPVPPLNLEITEDHVSKDLPPQPNNADALMADRLDLSAVLSAGEGRGPSQDDVMTFEGLLREAVRRRAALFRVIGEDGNHVLPPVGVLFSGGVDCTLLALMLHEVMPDDVTIDLINVAFENASRQTAGDCYSVPDRVTALDSFKELRELTPGRRWNLVLANIPRGELDEQRSHVRKLIHPLNTVLDDSIGCAIWFAARGRGVLHGDSADYDATGQYTSRAKVLLLGMGADEQLGGYSRYRSSYTKLGWFGVIQEMEWDVRRISARNLGRDDRCVADHGKEGRYPFLDEVVSSFLSKLPVTAKVDMTLERGVGEKVLLRMLASKLGLHRAAKLPKRAIQFGSRIARQGKGRANATDKFA